MNTEGRVELKNKSYNCRITFDEQGQPCIGWVMGFFDVDEDTYDIKKVGNETIVQIAKKLGIRRSSETLSVTRKLAKEWAKEAGQQELCFSTFQEISFAKSTA